MPRSSHSLSTRIACALVAVACAGALAGCKPPPALTKVELDAGKLSEKHPKVAPELESNCRKCHREQPPITQ